VSEDRAIRCAWTNEPQCDLRCDQWLPLDAIPGGSPAATIEAEHRGRWLVELSQAGGVPQRAWCPAHRQDGP
jgi:hypothetical protein